MRLVSDRDIMGRSIAFPPGVPVERVTLMRRAFEAVMKDKDFLADGHHAMEEIIPKSGGDVEGFVARILEFDVAQEKWTGRFWKYRLEINNNNIGDFNMVDATTGLIIERDNGEGEAWQACTGPAKPDCFNVAAKMKRIYKIEFNDANVGKAARKIGVRIPTLCHHDDLCLAGVCRICVVQVEGFRPLQAACAFPISC